CVWNSAGAEEPLAPTLARHADADPYAAPSREALALWARQNLQAARGVEPGRVDLLKPANTPADIAATLLYPVTDLPFPELFDIAGEWSAAVRAEVVDAALGFAARRGEFPMASAAVCMLTT